MRTHKIYADTCSFIIYTLQKYVHFFSLFFFRVAYFLQIFLPRERKLIRFSDETQNFIEIRRLLRGGAYYLESGSTAGYPSQNKVDWRH